MYDAGRTVTQASVRFDTLTTRDLPGLWLLACVTSAAVGTHGILYWDAGDYVTLAINGGRSGLFLGRPLFLLISHAIVQGIDPAWAEPVLRWFWTLVGALAAPAMAVLAVRLGLTRSAAWLAGAMVAVSPSFAHTAHQVLTDAPALALSIAALAAAAGGQAIATGVLLGAAILTRETAAIHVVPPCCCLVCDGPQSPCWRWLPWCAPRCGRFRLRASNAGGWRCPTTPRPIPSRREASAWRFCGCSPPGP